MQIATAIRLRTGAMPRRPEQLNDAHDAQHRSRCFQHIGIAGKIEYQHPDQRHDRTCPHADFRFCRRFLPDGATPTATWIPVYSSTIPIPISARSPCWRQCSPPCSWPITTVSPSTATCSVPVPCWKIRKNSGQW